MFEAFRKFFMVDFGPFRCSPNGPVATTTTCPTLIRWPSAVASLRRPMRIEGAANGAIREVVLRRVLWASWVEGWDLTIRYLPGTLNKRFF